MTPIQESKGSSFLQSKGSSTTVAGRDSAPGLHEAVSAFLLDRRIAGCTEATIASYRFQLNPFIGWCASRCLDLDTVSEGHIRTFLAERQAVSQSTLAAACGRLKTFFRWCEAHEFGKDYAHSISRVRMQQNMVSTLSDGQVRALLALCSSKTFTGKRDAALIRLLLDSGLRVSEALGLSLERLDLNGARLLVDGKGQKQRIAFFGLRTTRALTVYLKARQSLRPACQALFITRDGSQLTRRHTHKQLARLAQRAGLEGARVSPHILRHTFATTFLRNGGDALALQRLLGYSSLAMTNRYVHSSTEDLEAAYRRSYDGFHTQPIRSRTLEK